MSLHTIGSARRARLAAAADATAADAAYFQQVGAAANAMTDDELGEEREPAPRADFAAAAPPPLVRFDAGLFAPSPAGVRDAARLAFAPAGPAAVDDPQDDEPRHPVRQWLAAVFRPVPLDEEYEETTTADAPPVDAALRDEDCRQPVPADAPAFSEWSTQDVRDHADELRASYLGTFRGVTVVEDPALPAGAIVHTDAVGEQLPEPRRRHLPAWIPERLRPVPLPAIPDADRYRAVPVAPALAAPSPSETARLALEAASTAALFGEEEMRPDDFVSWLRWELADVTARCDAAIAEHALAAQADIDALNELYFQDADALFDDLNAATLPGWTSRLAGAGAGVAAR